MAQLLLPYVALSLALGATNTDYASKILQLSEKGTAHGNPELEKYLRSLTRDQMLQAARQGAKIFEKSGSRKPLYVAVYLPLAYYGEENGGLTDDALDKLLAILADRKEGEWFRFAVADLMYGDPFAPYFTQNQKERSVKTLTTVLLDRETPERVRRKCCASLRGVLEEGYTQVVYSDPAVRELRRTGPPERWKKVFSLIEYGEIKLAEKTQEQLVPQRARIHAVRKALATISRNEREPEDLRKFAAHCLGSLANLPLVNMEDSHTEQ